MVNFSLKDIIDEDKCFQIVRDKRWPGGNILCSDCGSPNITRQGKRPSRNTPARQRYKCKNCYKRFDDLTGTIFANKKTGLKTWILCLYFMGLNLSNKQIAEELDISPSTAQEMAERLRKGIVEKMPKPQLSNDVELDEVYITAGMKGHQIEVIKKTPGPQEKA